MLTLTARMDAGGALSALARLDLAALRVAHELPGDALAHEAGILSAASPHGPTGDLAAGYRVRPMLFGAQLSNAVDYFGFNLFGTGQRGAASNVPPSLFPGGGHYGAKPGMPAYRPLLAAWADAPNEIARYTEARIVSLFA